MEQAQLNPKCCPQEAAMIEDALYSIPDPLVAVSRKGPSNPSLGSP